MEQDAVENNGILNLDEMLGETKLKVRYQGKEYPVRTVKSLSPEEFGRVMAYGNKFSTLTDADLELEGGKVVMKAIDDVLEILAPALPRYKPTLKERFTKGYKRRFAVSMQEATKILEFWSENNRSKNAVRAVKPKTKRTRH
jgi:hypothetical protein